MNKEFKEQFPSLKEEDIIDHSGCYGSCLACSGFTIFIEDIQKHCLDKQKSKKVFDSWIKHLEIHIGTNEIDDCKGKLDSIKIIKKELGL